jgi:hypothetical protein
LLSVFRVLCAVSAVDARWRRDKEQASSAKSFSSFEFAVLGDFGTGSRQRSSSRGDGEMRALFLRIVSPWNNIYGGERPQDMLRKFKRP